MNMTRVWAEAWVDVVAELEGYRQRNTTFVTNLSNVCVADVIDAYRYCYGDRQRQGQPSLEELHECLRCMKENYLPLVLGAHTGIP